MGYILTAVNAPFSLSAVAVVVTWVMAVDVAGAVVVTWVMAVVVVVAVVVTGTLGVVWAGALAGAGNWVVAGAVVMVMDKLGKSFSKFHTFLILAGTSNIGLGLGWIVHQLLKPV